MENTPKTKEQINELKMSLDILINFNNWRNGRQYVTIHSNKDVSNAIAFAVKIMEEDLKKQSKNNQ